MLCEVNFSGSTSSLIQQHLSSGITMKPLVMVVFLLVGSLLSLSCGAVFKGSTQNITVQSSPPSSLKVSGSEMEYNSPTVLKLDRNKNYVLTFSKTGYDKATFEIKRHVSGGIVVLDILFGLVGVIVDAATGSWYNLEPKTITIGLSKISMIEGPEKIEIAVNSKNKDLVLNSSVAGVRLDITAVKSN